MTIDSSLFSAACIIMTRRAKSSYARYAKLALYVPMNFSYDHIHEYVINREFCSTDITIPLENHDTCDDDDDDDDEADEDPLERPPEPTVPDERVDSTSSSEGSRSRQDSPVKEDIRTMNRTRAQDLPMSGRRRTGAGDTASAISNLLSEIVGDRPYCQVRTNHGRISLVVSPCSQMDAFAYRRKNISPKCLAVRSKARDDSLGARASCDDDGGHLHTSFCRFLTNQS